MNKIADILAQLQAEQGWSPRFPVNRAERIERLAHPRQDPLPKKAGIYRIHMEGVPVLAYIGQSKDLRRRINELRGITDPLMPFTDPHIACPSLWAWAQMPPQRPYTVSFAVVDNVSAYWRQGLEDFVIAHARWMHKKTTGEEVWQTAYSPLANFHKLPNGYVSSSTRAKGYRGGPTPFGHVCHTPSIAPLGDLDDPRDPVEDLTWGGHAWSAWCEPEQRGEVKELQGLYRLRKIGAKDLLFLGHGSIDEAAKSAARLGMTDLLFSYVAGTWSYHEQVELLTDALGLYLRRTLSLPLAQYGGEENPQAGSAWPLRMLTTQTVSFLKHFISVQPGQRVSVLYENGLAGRA